VVTELQESESLALPGGTFAALFLDRIFTIFVSIFAK
jgi:hypothetical protein